MPDDKSKQAQDRKRISLSEGYELRYWSERFGVSPDELTRAVSAVGNDPEDVEKHLNDKHR
ncbi:MAG: DUF3606 domain-containing protein [Kofleriaceae bacterium]|nr:MAG: DUF3606 domain-containing protein [Kofleriaceae bacterium]MBZ0235011.1 DUF3606 domain-containing protein [Kofleriaceae bacterium]